MKIFLVVDDKDKLDEKLDLLAEQFPSANLCVFLTEASAELKNNAKIKKRLIAVCEKGKLQAEMDKYIKSNEADDIFLCYTSVALSEISIGDMKEDLIDGSQMIFFKEKNVNSFKKFFSKIYNWFVRMIFFGKDALATVKIQYISSEVVEKLKLIGWKFKIFSAFEVPFSIVEVDKPDCLSFSVPKKVHKNNYYNLIGLFGSIILFTLLMLFVKLPFLLALTLVFLIAFFVFMQIVFAVKNIIDERMYYDGTLPKPNHNK